MALPAGHHFRSYWGVLVHDDSLLSRGFQNSLSDFTFSGSVIPCPGWVSASTSYSELGSVPSSLNLGKSLRHMAGCRPAVCEAWSRSRLKCHKPLCWDFTTFFLIKHSSDFCQLLLLSRVCKCALRSLPPVHLLRGWKGGLGDFLSHRFAVCGQWLFHTGTRSCWLTDQLS